MSDLDFNTYLEKKDEPGISAFIFLKGDEHKFLSLSEYWTNNVSNEHVYTVRLTEEEFNCLDIGRHPKTFIYKDGKEYKTFDGVPELTAIRQEFRNIKSQRPRTAI